MAGALLFSGSFLVYLAVSRRMSVAYDAASMIGVARQLVNHLSLQASGGFEDYLHLSTPYSPYGIGTSLLIAPFYAVSKATGHEQAVLSLVNPAVMSTTTVVAYAIGRRSAGPRRSPSSARRPSRSARWRSRRPPNCSASRACPSAWR